MESRVGQSLQTGRKNTQNKFLVRETLYPQPALLIRMNGEAPGPAANAEGAIAAGLALSFPDSFFASSDESAVGPDRALFLPACFPSVVKDFRLNAISPK